MSNKNIVKMCSWILALVVLAIAGLVWASERLKGGVTAYEFFPLLGLGAFSLMWTHYVLGSLRRVLGVGARENKTYFKISSVAVLFFILLHPGILIAALYKDGFGLPPKSYLTVYGETGMKLAIGFGTISLIIFLLFELHRKFSKKSWWKYVDYAQIMAMFLIFYHGLTLGRELSVGWYKSVWYFYGLSLLSAIIYNYWYDRKAVEKNGGEHGKS